MLTKVENSKGTVKRHHFAHLAPAAACESWLHSTAKLLLGERICDAIGSGGSVPIRWVCPDDGMQHEKDLLNRKIIDAVEIKYFWSDKNIRPDIICSAAGQPVVIFKIIVTHKPEKAVLESGIPVLEVYVSDADDLDNLRSGVVNVKRIHNYPCPDPICHICHDFSSKCESTALSAQFLLKDIKRSKSKPKRMKPITQDKYGNVLHSKTLQQVRTCA